MYLSSFFRVYSHAVVDGVIYSSRALGADSSPEDTRGHTTIGLQREEKRKYNEDGAIVFPDAASLVP